MSEEVSEKTADPAVPVSDPNRFKALFVIAIAQLMIVLDASIVNLAIPSAQADLGISPQDVQWVVTAYTLAFGGLLLLGGRIADYTGRKRTFIIGLLGFAGAQSARRVGDELRPALRGPRAAGWFRGATGAGRPGPDHGHLPRPQGAGEGVRRLRCDLRRWCGHRVVARRRAHRVPVVALVPRGQRPDRDHRGTARDALRPRVQGTRRHLLRHPRRDHGDRRAAGAGLRLHPGGAHRIRRRRALDRREHAGLVRPGGRAADCLLLHREQVQTPTAPVARHPELQPGRCLHLVAHGRRGHVRHVLVPRDLHADDPRVLAGAGRVSPSCRSASASSSAPASLPTCCRRWDRAR